MYSNPWGKARIYLFWNSGMWRKRILYGAKATLDYTLWCKRAYPHVPTHHSPTYIKTFSSQDKWTSEIPVLWALKGEDGMRLYQRTQDNSLPFDRERQKEKQRQRQRNRERERQTDRQTETENGPPLSNFCTEKTQIATSLYNNHNNGYLSAPLLTSAQNAHNENIKLDQQTKNALYK